jgi:uncharacterized iron-regulated membrane protein
MNWSHWLRQVHRWLAIVFTVGFLMNVVVAMQGKYIAWVGLLALIPLILLMITGLYMFVQPYAARWRSPRAAGG